jgi:hypothetical protein
VDNNRKRVRMLARGKQVHVILADTEHRLYIPHNIVISYTAESILFGHGALSPLQFTSARQKLLNLNNGGCGGGEG